MKCLATARDVLKTQRQSVWNNAPEGLSGTDLTVFNCFLLHADPAGETFVRTSTIAREIRRGERTVRRSIARLRSFGVLDVMTERTRTGRANIYRLLLGTQAANDGCPRSSSAPLTPARHGDLVDGSPECPSAEPPETPSREQSASAEASSPTSTLATRDDLVEAVTASDETAKASRERLVQLAAPIGRELPIKPSCHTEGMCPEHTRDCARGCQIAAPLAGGGAMFGELRESARGNRGAAAEFERQAAEHRERDLARRRVEQLAQAAAWADGSASPTPPAAHVSAPGSGQIGSTHAATVAAPPPLTPSSDRSQVNDPPLSPPQGGERRVGSTIPKKSAEPRPRPRVDFDTVQRVLAYFIARLWPEAVGAPVTRKRRRYVEARLRELAAGSHPELAEQTLRDAVDGAKLHPWHREADTGFHADRVFRDADTVEQLAKLGRARRLQEARLAAGRARAPSANAARSSAASAPPAALSHEQMAADLERLFGRAWRKGA